MALLSPGIQLFESSVTPPVTAVAADNGIATIGFSTRGPVGKLTRVNDTSEFQKIFGDPVKDNYWAHMLVRDVLANKSVTNADVYFMRIADRSAEEAKCPVIDFPIKGAKVAIKDNISKSYAGYLMAFYDKAQGATSISEPSRPYIEIKYGNSVVYTELNCNLSKDFPPAESDEHDYVLWNSIDNIIANLEGESGLNSLFSFGEVARIGEDASEVGIIVAAEREKKISPLLSELTVRIGDYDKANNAFTPYGGEGSNVVINNPPTVETSGTFGGKELRPQSTLDSYRYEDMGRYSRFELTARFSGSSMNNFKITKTTSTSNGKKMWTVSVFDGVESENSLESMTFEADNLELFEKKMGQFEYIDISNVEKGSEQNKWTWENDGVWVLGEGQRLSNGEYWCGYEEGEGPDPTYVVQKGTDGYPTTTNATSEQYSEDQANRLYIEALGDESFLNTDEINFSILAIPGTQNTGVQNAAIEVCAARGDAIFLADVPKDYCGSKSEIEDVVRWSSNFQSSYCAIYYGWFDKTNYYNSDSNITLPASCFVAPKMLMLDNSDGEFFAPAGTSRGTIICSDWLYSPDQNDRDKLVGNDNVVNPISYSNTRGVVIMAQKTTDRSTSPLNRVGVRRMTNMIKRVLRSQLVSLLFEPNNEVARAKARTIVDRLLSGLTNKCIETYDISVVSGTGANRNDLNVYLSFAPYGLIEKIYVYLSITDAGVEVTETVA